MKRAALNRGSLGLAQALFLVVGNVVGMGIFLTPGAVLQTSGSTAAALWAWVVGGGMALSAALVLGECASRFPANGGDYLYLREGLGRPVGFLSGWASFTVGFPGSMASLAVALAELLGSHVQAPTSWLAAAIIAAATLVALLPIRVGAGMNGLVVLVSLGLLTLVVARGLAGPAPPHATAAAPPGSTFAPGMGAALVWVFFAYSGWNVVAYVAAECRSPSRTVPLAMLAGLGLVTALYVLFNLALFRQADPAALLRSVEHPEVVLDLVGRALGEGGAAWAQAIVSGGIATTLLSTTLAGPRVTAEMAARGDFFAGLAARGGDLSRRPIPVRATLLQGAIALALVFSGTFTELLAWTTAVMLLFGGLSAVAQIRLRHADRRAPGVQRIFRDPLYPLPAIATLSASAWVLLAVASHGDPLKILSGVLLTLLGLPLYFWLDHRRGRPPNAAGSGGFGRPGRS